jgi:spore coat polysaccharide biosynthesis protein SpsF
MIDCCVMVQARMTSRRFPGKVLAPLDGIPVIAHVLSHVCETVPRERVILATSEDSTDDPLAAYVETCVGLTVFRGSLENVFVRFQDCLREHSFEWFIRICGDSPTIDSGLLAWMMERASDSCDLLTNVGRRTFPTGQSIEIVRRRTFLGVEAENLTSEEREHATLHFYRFPEQYRILNVSSGDVSLSQRRLVVDTLEDLRALERILTENPNLARGFAARAQLDQ